MPARKVKPFRPTIAEISKMIRESPDDYWIDDRGRTYGFVKDDYTRALWDRGVLGDDEAHLWVLLPKPRAGAKSGEFATFPTPDERAKLRPLARPRASARMTIVVQRYLSRPRRQRAAAILASVEEYGRPRAPTGRVVAAEANDTEIRPGNRE